MPFVLGKTIGEIYLKRLAATPNLALFEHKVKGQWKRVKMIDFDAEVRKVAYGLIGLGVEPGEKIALISTTRLEWSMCDMAILGAGGIAVPIYPSIPAEDVVFILEHSESVLAIVENGSQLEKILNHRAKLPRLRKIIVIEPSAMAQAMNQPDVLSLQALGEIAKRQEVRAPRKFEKNMTAARPEDLFTICYTSGTTGQPKGAMITHDNLVSLLEDVAKITPKILKPDREILITFLPFSHILGRVESLATYLFGWRECYAESPETLLKDMIEVRPTFMFAVPRIFEKAKVRIDTALQAQSPTQQKLYHWALEVGRAYYSPTWKKQKPSAKVALEYRLARKLVFNKISARMGGRLKAAICGGAPLPQEIAEYFQIVGIPILEGYGLTEANALAVNRPESLRPGTVGKPLPEVSVKIGEDGEVLIKSRKVFMGYYKMPEETAEAITDGWLHTGDIGDLDADGFLHITDRKKDLIITSAGKNVAPQKIENLLKTRPYLSHAVVFGDRRNYLVALVTLDRDQIKSYADQQQILFSDMEGLAKNSKVRGLIQKQIEDINHGLASYETLKKFIILPQEFTIETGELTPSLKVKRRWVYKKFRTEIDQMYNEA